MPHCRERPPWRSEIWSHGLERHRGRSLQTQLRNLIVKTHQDHVSVDWGESVTAGTKRLVRSSRSWKQTMRKVWPVASAA